MIDRQIDKVNKKDLTNEQLQSHVPAKKQNQS